MENNVLFKVSGLNKTLGKRQILHDISFEAYAGEVFGFLGPNGAGKTTTIKIAVGLLGIESGSVEIAGCDIKKNFEGAMAQIGAIVENPEMYKYLTGRQNLEQYARIRGVDKKRVDEVTEIVRLSNRIDDKISKYSLGMRQRLGVAQAILHRPKVLILDEPTNGLDPAGIKELRDILKKLAHEEKICVIVSSHLMSEMELMCDRVGIIANGRMLGVHALADIVNSSNSSRVKISMRVDDVQRAFTTGLFKELSATSDENVIHMNIAQESCDEEVAQLIKNLIYAGVKIYSVSEREHDSLENVFIHMTQNEQGGGQIG